MKRSTRARSPFLVAALLSLAALRGTAAADPPAPPPPDRTLSPYFVVDGGDPGVDALPLKATSAAIDVSGVIASVTVTQTYANEGKRPLHARYVFPASTRAAVHGLRMTIGERVITAKIKQRDEARAEFEQAKQEGKSASLLEEDRPNVFTMNVANILPGDRIEVELRYTELVVPTDGTYELIYPTVVGPRYSSQAAATAPAADRFVAAPYTREGHAPSYAFALTARVASGIPIQTLTVPTHQVQIDWRGRTEARVALAASERDGGDRDFVLRYQLAGEQIQSGLMLYPGATERFFLLMVEPPRRVTPAQIPPREYVFIVDVSGSMHGFPLDTAKQLLRDLAAGLRPTDTFNVILFSGAHELMAPASVPATADNVAAALALIDKQDGGGGTELGPALEQAMSLPAAPRSSRSFVVVTDGFIAEEKAAFQYIRRHLGRANVFSFGIGSSVNRHLVDGVAKAGMGESFVVTEPGEAAATAARFKRYIEAPVLTDIEIEYAGFKAYDVEPVSIPDVMARRPIVVHGKWAGPATGTITVKGTSGDGAYHRSFEVARASSGAQHEALSYLWARSRIAALSDFAFGDETEAEKQEIIALGLAYNLLTRHTSFIAVDQLVRNHGVRADEVDQPLPLPSGVSDLAVGYGEGSEPGLLALAAAIALAAAATRLGRRRARAARR
jgi:Ca-activated chloride channel family protein